MKPLAFTKRAIALISLQAGKKSLSRTLGWMDQYLEDAINKVITKLIKSELPCDVLTREKGLI